MGVLRYDIAGARQVAENGVYVVHDHYALLEKRVAELESELARVQREKEDLAAIVSMFQRTATKPTFAQQYLNQPVVWPCLSGHDGDCSDRCYEDYKKARAIENKLWVRARLRDQWNRRQSLTNQE